MLTPNEKKTKIKPDVTGRTERTKMEMADADARQHLEDLADEIKRELEARNLMITPAMLRAGIDAFYAYDSRFDDVDDGVIRIWRAMVSAMKSE